MEKTGVVIDWSGRAATGGRAAIAARWPQQSGRSADRKLVELLEEEQRRQLRDARDSVRRAYRAASREIEAEFWASYEAFSGDFYDGELEALEASLNDLTGSGSLRCSGVHTTYPDSNRYHRSSTRIFLSKRFHRL